MVCVRECVVERDYFPFFPSTKRTCLLTRGREGGGGKDEGKGRKEGELELGLDSQRRCERQQKVV